MVRRVLDVTEIIVFVLIIVADAYGWVPITQTVYLLPWVLVCQWLRRQKLSAIGLSLPPNVGKAVVFGVLAGATMELSAVLVTTPLIAMATGMPPDYSDLADIRGSIPMLLIFLGLSWTLAAFGEELCFRGFLMNRVAARLGDGKAAWIASLVLSSVLFGWGHTEQGVSGWVQEGWSGLLLGLLFLWTGRNLLVPMIAHGVANSLAFVLIYLGRYPGS